MSHSKVIKSILDNPKNKLTEESVVVLKKLSKQLNAGKKYIFSEFDMVNMIIKVGEMHCHPEWIPQQDSGFVEFLHKRGLLKTYERVYGKVAKKYKPKQ